MPNGSEIKSQSTTNLKITNAFSNLYIKILAAIVSIAGVIFLGLIGYGATQINDNSKQIPLIKETMITKETFTDYKANHSMNGHKDSVSKRTFEVGVLKIDNRIRELDGKIDRTHNVVLEIREELKKGGN